MKSITVNSFEMAVVDSGAGDPVLLVHGFPLDHSMWNEQIEVLSADYRVIAPDLRGFGESPFNWDPFSWDSVAETEQTIERFADDLDALLYALEVTGPVHYCGLSMGGYIAWQFWRKYSSRVGSLILCDTRATADSPEGAEGRKKMAEQVLREGSIAAAEAMMPKLVWSETANRKPEVARAIRQMILRTAPATICAAQRAMASRIDATRLLGEINVPALLIVGRYDVLSPVDQMRSIAEAMPNATMVEIPEAGHMAPMENPEAVNQVIADFLRA